MSPQRKREDSLPGRIGRFLRRRELRQARKHNQWLEAHKPRMIASTWQGGSSSAFQFIAPEETDVPVTGSILAYGGASAPPGYLLCDGSAVSRVTYANLFAILGTTYGVGDGANTFNLPDLAGRAPYGVGANADMNARGNSDGLANASRSPRHAHPHGHNQVASSTTVFGTLTSDPQISLNPLNAAIQANTGTGSQAGYLVKTGAASDTTLAPAPFQVVNYIIKT